MRLRVLLPVAALLVIAGAFAWWNATPRSAAPPPHAAASPNRDVVRPAVAATAGPVVTPAATTTESATEPWLLHARRNAWIDASREDLPAQLRDDLRAGRFRAAAEALRTRTSQSDDAAYSLLTQLIAPCLQSNANVDAAAQRQRLLDLSGRFGGDTAARGRLPKLLDLRQQLTADLRQQLCPDAASAADWDAYLAAENARRSAAFNAEFGAVSKLPEAQRAATVRAIEDRLAADNPQRRAELAAQRLQQSDPALRRSALTTLQELAGISGTARFALARCMLAECLPDAGDKEQGVNAMISAAKNGSVAALFALGAPMRSSEASLSFQPREVPATERYGWWKVREQLVAEGCLGVDAAIRQAVQPSGAIDLMRMNAAEAREAQLRADQLWSEALPAVRSALRCD